MFEMKLNSKVSSLKGSQSQSKPVSRRFSDKIGLPSNPNYKELEGLPLRRYSTKETIERKIQVLTITD